ncbi:MAG: cobalamin biosynthesis protein [Candidatus Adiutrix sp.]|jgi:cobalt-precorrin 5A hydrolase|nr:cobalamin biosynthesis protein [Candidatus Adiutrix sp.]
MKPETHSLREATDSPHPPTFRRVAVYALTRRGAELAARLRDGLAPLSEEAALFLPRRLAPVLERIHGAEAATLFDTLQETLAENFHSFHGHLVVGAAGMVVRLIAPLLTSKKDDPAVVVLPQDGRFAVSLLSGHLGGGNQLAWEAARVSGGQAVVSTATDVEGLPALEVLARDCGLILENFAALPKISRRLVDGERVTLFDPHRILRPHLEPWADRFECVETPPAATVPQVRVDWRERPDDGQVLCLRPQAVVLGLGCHRGIDVDEMREFIQATLAEAKISPLSVALLASVETRRTEPALLTISREMSRPFITFTKEELGGVATPNPSAKVAERIGVPSVCEAAAMLAARTGSLLISKKKSARGTLAAALRGWE